MLLKACTCMNPALSRVSDVMCIECDDTIEIMTDPGLLHYVHICRFIVHDICNAIYIVW